MNQLHVHKTALFFATAIGGMHLLWSVAVGAGIAQRLVNFASALHMLKPIVTVTDFNPGFAAILVIGSSIAGYVLGYVLAIIWNHLHS